MLVALVSAVPAFAADAAKGKAKTTMQPVKKGAAKKVEAPKVEKPAAPAEEVKAPEAPKADADKSAKKAAEDKEVKKEDVKEGEEKPEVDGEKKEDAEEAGFLTKAQDGFLVVVKNPYVQVATIGSAVAGISAFATNYYNKNYVEKKKKRMNPGIIAAAAGLLTAGAAGTYIFWDSIHAYVFAGANATDEAAAKGDVASKKLKEDAEVAAKAAPKVEAKPEADAKK